MSDKKRHFAIRWFSTLVLLLAFVSSAHADTDYDIGRLDESVRAVMRMAGKDISNKNLPGTFGSTSDLAQKIRKDLRAQRLALINNNDLDQVRKSLALKLNQEQMDHVSDLSVQIDTVGVRLSVTLDATELPMGITDQRTALQKLRSSAMQTAKGLPGTVAKASYGMGVQTVYFQIATGLFATFMAGIFYKDDPMAVQDFLGTSVSLEGAIPLGLFIATNHPTAIMLHKIRAGILPRSMIPYLSMSIATVASQMMVEMYADKDLYRCVATKMHFIPGGTDDAACDKATRNWMLHDKIMQYAPQITGMIAQIGLSSATSLVYSSALRGVISGSTAADAYVDAAIASGKEVKWVLTGARILRGGASAAAFLAELNPMGASVAIGGLIVFFTWNKIVQEPVNDSFDAFRLADFDVKAWLEKQGFHYEFAHRDDFSQQPVADAFDVMATNLAAGDLYYDKLIALFSTDYTNLQKPVASCEPESQRLELPSIYHGKNLEPNWYDKFIFLIPVIGDTARAKLIDRTYVNYVLKKSDAQLECEIEAQPLKLLQRYADNHKAWRDVLLGRFTRRMDIWRTVMSNFNDVYGIAKVSAKYLAALKYSHKDDNKAPPKITRELLLSATGTAAPPEAQAQTADAVASHPDYVGRFITKDMTDYVIASLACGPKSKDVSFLGGIWNSTKQALGQVTDGSNFITIPYGSSFVFNPPNITTGDGSICNLHIVNPKAPPQRISTRNVVIKDENGYSYPSLYDYVYANLDPAIWKGVYGSMFLPFWTSTVSESVEKVWSNYEKSYLDLVHSELRPVLFDRAYRSGCNRIETPGPETAGYDPDSYLNSDDGYINESSDNQSVDTRRAYYAKGMFGIPSRSSWGGERLCHNPPGTYRVGYGVILSIELELRQYLRGLEKIMAPDGPRVTSTPFDRQTYLETANDLILQVRALSRMVDGLKTADFKTKLEEMSNSFQVLSDVVNASFPAEFEYANDVAASRNSTPKGDLRRKLAKQILQNTKTILAEAQGYSTWATLMSFVADGEQVMPPAVNHKNGVGFFTAPKR